MDGNEVKRRAIGFGSTRSADADDILALVRAALSSNAPVQILATVDRRSDVGTHVAAALGLRLQVFSASMLAAVTGTRTRSELAASAIGTPSVAEAAALAAIGSGGVLLDARRVGRGCTCAVAEER